MISLGDLKRVLRLWLLASFVGRTTAAVANLNDDGLLNVPSRFRQPSEDDEDESIGGLLLSGGFVLYTTYILCFVFLKVDGLHVEKRLALVMQAGRLVGLIFRYIVPFSNFPFTLLDILGLFDK